MSRGAALALAAACALLGGLVAVAIVRERPPAAGERSDAPAAPCACEGAAAAGAPRPAPASDSERGATGAAAHEVARFSVCEREETRAALAELALVRGRPALWALHCGRSMHLIALEPLDGALVPQRVAVVQAASASPAEAAVALEPLAADVNGDGRADWIAPAAFADATGVPRGGGVYALYQRAEGGFEAPVRLVAAAPGSAVAAQLDDDAAQDLVVLQRADASVGRADELWLLTGGPSPVRTAQRPARVSTRAIAALDLDLDRKDDLVAASRGDGSVLLWLSSGGALAQVTPTELALPGVEQLLPADVDHDGTRELVLVTERTWLLPVPVQAPTPPTSGIAPALRGSAISTPVPIAGSENLRDLHLADTDGDGKPELVGYAHPDLIALRPIGEQRFERVRVLSLRGDGSVLFARLAALDADPRPDLVVVTLASGTAREVEIAVTRNLEPAAVVQLAARASPIGEAALVQRFTLL